MSNEKQNDELEEIIHDLSALVIALRRVIKKVIKYKCNLLADKGGGSGDNTSETQ